MTFNGATHHVQYLEKLDFCAMTTDHELITCSCRVGQKGDLCAPKIAMMKIQKFSAFKAFGLNPAGENEDAAENEDDYANVTMGEHLDEPELGSLSPEVHSHGLDHDPNVSTVEQRKLADTRQQLERALASLREPKPLDKQWLDRMHAVSTEVL